MMAVKVCVYVCVMGGGVGRGGVLPWCLVPNGIREEQQHKGDKVKLRCCQLRLTASGPSSRGTGALSRHRSHFLSPPAPSISHSFFSHFIVPPPTTTTTKTTPTRHPTPKRSSCLPSALHDAATTGWTFFRVYFPPTLNQNKNRTKFLNQSSILGPFVILRGLSASFRAHHLLLWLCVLPLRHRRCPVVGICEKLGEYGHLPYCLEVSAKFCAYYSPQKRLLQYLPWPLTLVSRNIVSFVVSG